MYFLFFLVHWWWSKNSIWIWRLHGKGLWFKRYFTMVTYRSFCERMVGLRCSTILSEPTQPHPCSVPSFYACPLYSSKIIWNKPYPGIIPWKGKSGAAAITRVLPDLARLFARLPANLSYKYKQGNHSPISIAKFPPCPLRPGTVVHPSPPPPCHLYKYQCWYSSPTCTRGVEAFLKKTAIAYHQNLTFLLGSWPYAIAVFFKNASTPRVPYIQVWYLPARRQCQQDDLHSERGHKSLLQVATKKQIVACPYGQ